MQGLQLCCKLRMALRVHMPQQNLTGNVLQISTCKNILPLTTEDLSGTCTWHLHIWSSETSFDVTKRRVSIQL